MQKIRFTPGHPTNHWRLLALRPIDLVNQAIQNTGSTSISVVSLEIWRIISVILYGLEPGQLKSAEWDDLATTLYEKYEILLLRDIELLIKKVEQSKKPLTSIVIGSDDR